MKKYRFSLSAAILMVITILSLNPFYVMAVGAFKDPIAMSQVPPDLNPEIGMRLEMGGVNGEIMRVVVTEIGATHITLDANPPLAGALTHHRGPTN